MPAEKLDLYERSMDAIISRFGLLMFGEPAASAREMARVLRAGGAFSVAVWEDMTRKTLVNTAIGALRPRVRPELMQGFDRLNDLEGQREGLLRAAGFSEIQSEWFHWNYEFADHAELQHFVSGPGIFPRLFQELDQSTIEQVYSEVFTRLAAYRLSNGAYSIPHSCLLLWGRREIHHGEH
jgi:SAM-dependent methyltransferase